MTLLTRDDLAGLPPVAPTGRYRYGEQERCFADLYLPASDEPPRRGWAVALLLHGGCWRASVSLDYLGQAARALTERGLAAWNVEYRRLGDPGGGWPATFEDVAAAADLLREVAAGQRLDLGRVVAVGHSAGGHLALWLAARRGLPRDSVLWRPDPLPLHGVVSLAGIPDLAEAVRRGICQEAPAQLMGGAPDAVAERYREGSPAELLPLGVPQVHLCGAHDEIVPADYVAACVGAVQARGDRARLRVLEDSGHFEPAVAGTAAWTQVEDAVLSLVAETGGRQGVVA